MEASFFVGKQPATNLWTTRASQGKKTLTNPYDRSLIALS